MSIAPIAIAQPLEPRHAEIQRDRVAGCDSNHGLVRGLGFTTPFPRAFAARLPLIRETEDA